MGLNLTPLTIPHGVVVAELPAAGQLLCQHCGADLDVSQPDERRPDRLAGYCSVCDSWCLVHDRIVVGIDLDGLVAQARARFTALRRRVGPAPHLADVAAPGPGPVPEPPNSPVGG
jgi:hypothetical protein